MGLMSGIIGNASEMKMESLNNEYGGLLCYGEEFVKGYKLIRDSYLFTNKRIIIIDKQGLTSKKISYITIPYSRITQFTIETAGHFDLESELKIWVSGQAEPHQATFSSGVDIRDVQKIIVENM